MRGTRKLVGEPPTTALLFFSPGTAYGSRGGIPSTPSSGILPCHMRHFLIRLEAQAIQEIAPKRSLSPISEQF